jgi:hypothetical protein
LRCAGLKLSNRLLGGGAKWEMADTLEPFQKPVCSQGRYLLAGLAILIAALGGYVGWQHHARAKLAAATASAFSPAIPVSVATAQRRDVPIYLTGLGTVQAFNRTRVDGELIKVAFTRRSGRQSGRSPGADRSATASGRLRSSVIV